VGSKVVKRYDAPQTPYQRVLAAGVLTAPQQQALAAEFSAVLLRHHVPRMRRAIS